MKFTKKLFKRIAFYILCLALASYHVYDFYHQILEVHGFTGFACLSLSIAFLFFEVIVIFLLIQLMIWLLND